MSYSYIKLNKPRRNVIFTKLNIPKKIINHEIQTSLTTSLNSSRTESKVNINNFRESKKILLTSIYNLSLSRNYSNSPFRKSNLKFVLKNKNNSYRESISYKNITLNKTINIIDSNSQSKKRIKKYYNDNNNKCILNHNNYMNKNLNLKLEVPKLKKDDSSKIRCLMRKKFYFDVKKKMDDNFKKKDFSSDKKLINTITHLNQVITFWKGVCDIVHPIITIEKYKKKSNNFKNILIKNDSQILSHKFKPLPKIITNSKLLPIKHYDKFTNEKKFMKILKENKKLISE